MMLNRPFRFQTKLELSENQTIARYCSAFHAVKRPSSKDIKDIEQEQNSDINQVPWHCYKCAKKQVIIPTLILSI